MRFIRGFTAAGTIGLRRSIQNLIYHLFLVFLITSFSLDTLFYTILLNSTLNKTTSIHRSFAFADNCSGKKYDSLDKTDPKDPCGEKKIKEIGGHVGVTSSVAHGVAGVTCLVACVSPLNITGNIAIIGDAVDYCQYAGFVTMGIDVVGSLAVQLETRRVTGKFDSNQLVGTLGTVVLGAIPILVSALDDPSKASDFIDHSDGTTTADIKKDVQISTDTKTQYDGQACTVNGNCPDASKQTEPKKKLNKGSCLAAVIHGVQTVLTGATAASAYVDASKANKNKGAVLSEQNHFQTPGGSFKTSPKLVASNTAPDLRASITNDGSATSEQTGELANTLAASMSPEQKKIMDDYKKVTGKSAKEVFDLMEKTGADAFSAASAVAADSLGATGLSLAEKIKEHADGLSDETKAKLAQEELDRQAKLNSRDFASARAVGPVGKKQNSPLDGLSEVLSGLIPGEKKKEEKQQALVNFNGRDLASKTTKEGYHPANQSLFEVINSRYNTLNKTVLNEGF